MSIRKFIICVVTIISSVYACKDAPVTQEPAVFKQVPEIQEVTIGKQIKVKLKRNAKDDYTWEIQGDDVEEIISADKKMRKGLTAE